ncbi:hypothetical protein [Rivularia sp. UHCC 0363]|uniref:hypothetical protein n=1 Tax=Rivularia sp. UHCC 0363 TaxID=3110244 RepID=UPI002B1EDC60|nr:hypothetical protein [Rivularia sp. UHCC 0363]MEA5598197.1 hypothetical protein [Rivularia sp. UHCC 0363]
MKATLRQILKLKKEYNHLPFFDFLRDESLSARQRLEFYPCMAPFIMSFGDLNRYVMRLEPTSDAYQAMVNEHSYEDDHHWQWYLEDFIKLGFDRNQISSTEYLHFLYSDRTVVNRLLSHKLAHLIYSSSSIVRLAIIEAIEETGNVLFELIGKLAVQIEAETGLELRYCGEFHFSKESGHAMTCDHAMIAQIEMDEETRIEAIEKVNLVFVWFREWTEELLTYAKQNSNYSDEVLIPNLHKKMTLV